MPLVVVAIMILVLASRSGDRNAPGPIAYTRWWPDWRDSLIWRIGVVTGSVNSMYFCSNAFLPGYLTSAGRADLISAALTALNLGQLPASFLLLAVAGRLERRVWPFVVAGIMALIGILGIVTTANEWTIVSAAMLGFACAGVLALGLALPPLLCAPADVGRTSAAMFTIGYGWAVAVSIISGAVWDLTGIASLSFLPIALSGLPLILVTPTIRFTPPEGN